MIGDGTELEQVTLAGAAADVVSATQDKIVLTATTGDAGSGNVIVTSKSGAVVTLEGAFTYLEEGAIALVTPSRGQRGTYVTIHGTNLLGGGSELVEITIGGVEPASVVSYSDSAIKIRAAPSVDLGPGDIVIVSETGANVLGENSWTYDKPSNITNVCI